MEFIYKNEQYRLERGVKTGRWILMHNPGGHVGWRMRTLFDAAIHDEDIVDRAKVFLSNERKTTNEA